MNGPSHSSTLHTLSSSWHDSTWLFEQLAFAADGDTILLLQDAVLAVHSPITLASFLAKCQTQNVSVAALEDDRVLRGVVNHYAEIREVDYAGFVELCVKHDKQVAW